jgi:tRNA (guanine-N7-)-methyltransferase
MGRRSLRKISPDLDLSFHLQDPDQLPETWTSSAVFGRDAPLEVEIGCGKGMFIVAASTERSQHDFLGIEVSRKYARFAAARLARAGRTNAKMICAEARKSFAQRLSSNSVRAVHVYFPDPWWKKRHKPRRVMNEPFLRDVERVLVPGGSLHFWTDVEEYYAASVALIQQVTDLEGPLHVPERPAEHESDYRTHFERRTRLHDETVYRSEFRRRLLI